MFACWPKSCKVAKLDTVLLAALKQRMGDGFHYKFFLMHDAIANLWFL